VAETGAGREGLPLQIRTVRGDPYEVDGRRLIPVTRIVSLGKARAMVGSNQVSGWAGGFVRITPVAILEETVAGERRIPITNATATALRGIVGTVMAMTLFLTLLRWLFRKK
jgi:uncharacterized spore protein YtfJ